MQDFLTNIPQYLQILTAVISAASLIAAITPTPKDDSFLAMARKLVDLLALNFGNAKNEVKK